MGDAIGFHHGRSDLERIGLFAEMGYLHGKGAPTANIDIRDMKNPQMHPGVPKWKSGLQDCYFDQKFKRIFEKEGYTTPYIIEVNFQKERNAKYPNLKPFLPPSFPKKHATPGDSHGTFGGNIKAFSPSLKPQPPQEKLPLNFTTQPGKKGGPGYPDICINKYPVYKSSPYDDPKIDASQKRETNPPFLGGSYPSYFDKNPYLSIRFQATYKEEFTKPEFRSGPFIPSSKNKTLDGCFSKFPVYKSSPYILPKPDKGAMEKTESLAGPFKPQPHDKSMYTKSIMGNKIDIAVNDKNWRNFKPITYTKEFLS